MYEETMYENEFIKFFKIELMKEGFSSGALEVEHRGSTVSGQKNVAIVFEGTKAFHIYELVIEDRSKEKKEQLQTAEDELRKYMDMLDYPAIKAYLVWLEEKNGHKKYEEYEMEKPEPIGDEEKKPELDKVKEKEDEEKKPESDKVELKAAEVKEPEQIKKERFRKKRKKRVITIICLSGGVVMLVLFIMSFFISISDKQVLLLFAAIMLFIVPFSKKINIPEVIEIEPGEEEESKSST